MEWGLWEWVRSVECYRAGYEKKKEQGMFLTNPNAPGCWGKEQKSDDRSVPPPGTPLQLFFLKTNTLQHWITVDYILAIQHDLFRIILVYIGLCDATYFANTHATLVLVAPPCCRDTQTRILELCHPFQLVGPRNGALR